ncbi:unnamed protein product [Ilex paraguariensis]|uniref:Hexosyltransferase n=1 Tax=Ilex paraguariensis TaxID=185542 RepID=A0ABC8SLV2_9AQUA
MGPGVPADVLTGTGKLSVPITGYYKRAYVTFLAGNGDYVKGVVGLAKGLRKTKSAYPLVVAILPDVPEEHREILRSQGCIVEEIEPIYPPENQIQFAMAYYVINYSKLRIWNVSETNTLYHKFLAQSALLSHAYSFGSYCWSGKSLPS